MYSGRVSVHRIIYSLKLRMEGIFSYKARLGCNEGALNQLKFIFITKKIIRNHQKYIYKMSKH